MPKYALTARAQMHGAVRDPGYVFELAEGEIGPHRTVVASDHGSQIADHIGGSPSVTDIPLYVELEDDKPAEEKRDSDEPKLIEDQREPEAKPADAELNEHD